MLVRDGWVNELALGPPYTGYAPFVRLQVPLPTTFEMAVSLELELSITNKGCGGVLLGVTLGVTVEVNVWVGVGVGVLVGVSLTVGVGVLVAVSLTVGVGVSVGVSLGVGVGVEVGVGVGQLTNESITPFTMFTIEKFGVVNSIL